MWIFNIFKKKTPEIYPGVLGGHEKERPTPIQDLAHIKVDVRPECLKEPVAREKVEVKTDTGYYCPCGRRTLTLNFKAKLLYCEFCDSTYKLPKVELEIVERGR